MNSPVRQSCPSVPTWLNTVIAVQHIRKMRGGAQSHLMRCSNDRFYVVKFRNNPQHPRVLFNEMFASKLAQRVGLPVAGSVIVEVTRQLIERTPELNIQLVDCTVACQAGLQFGSEYVVNPLTGQCIDYLPVEMLKRVWGLSSFGLILALDKWTGNTDARQAIFWRTKNRRTYNLAFIDQGYCFNGGDWTFTDTPFGGVYGRNEVYAHVRGWDSLLMGLAPIENLHSETIWSVAKQIPPEWYDSDFAALGKLVETLIERQTRIRPLIDAFRKSHRNPFPNWREE